MRTLLTALSLLVTYSAFATEGYIELKDTKTKSDSSYDYNRSCKEVAKTYARGIEKLIKSGKLNVKEVPLLRSSGKNGEVLVHGNVEENTAGEKVARVTYTYPDSGISKTMNIKLPENSMVINIPGINGDMPLEVHVGGNCVKARKQGTEGDFLCNGKADAVADISNKEAELMIQDTSFENRLFSHMERISNFHTQNNLSDKIQVKDHAARACLSMNESKDFDAYKVFRTLAPNSKLTKQEFTGNGGGGGLGGAGARIVSTSRR